VTKDMHLFGPSMATPLADVDTQEFWDACKEHRLVVPQCSDCGYFRFAPMPLCYNCRSFSFRWVQAQGVGEIYTWTVVYRSVHPATEEAVPYNAVVVKLHDCGGAMITSNLLEVDNEDIRAGMKVSVVWDDVTQDCTLPRFRLIESVASSTPSSVSR
jgi:uncharacterized protein